jgi:hypothetical protein
MDNGNNLHDVKRDRSWIWPLNYKPIFHSFIHQWLYSPLLGRGLFFSFVLFFTQSVGFLGRVISSSQGRYLHTGHHKHRINAYTDIHALSGIRAHDPSVRASEDSSCLRSRGHCDWRIPIYSREATVNGVYLSTLARPLWLAYTYLLSRGHCDWRIPIYSRDIKNKKLYLSASYTLVDVYKDKLLFRTIRSTIYYVWLMQF